MKFVKIFNILLVLLIFGIQANAQKPSWSVNAADYNYSMSYIGTVYIDNQKVIDTTSMVAAFVGNEVRGVAKPKYDDKTKNVMFYLLCYSNEEGQTLTFKFYNGAKNEVITFDRGETFEADAVKGSPFAPAIWAKPELKDANMLSFSLAKQKYSEIVGKNINVVVPVDADMTNDVATFEISPGAVADINGKIQVSGVTNNTYTTSMFYTITAADNKTVNTYKVNIIRDDLKNLVATEIVSPNGDNFNDFWTIESVEKYKQSSFYIYTNTGQLVYESVGYNNDWNGTYKNQELPMGVYYYVIKDAQCSDCKLVGTISLVR